MKPLVAQTEGVITSFGNQRTDVKACLKETGCSGKWTYCWDIEGIFVYGD